MSIDLVKVADIGNGYLTYQGETGATTQGQMQDYMKNQNEILRALVQNGLWQPSMAVQQGQIIKSPNMPAGCQAIVTTAGTTGTAEPVWTVAGTSITDGSAKYVIFYGGAVAGRNAWRPGMSVSVGDIYYPSEGNGPNYLRLECITAGKTGTSEPDLTTVSSGGGHLADGSVIWIVDDIRDGNRVGSVVGSIYLPPGYVKANGAVVNRADYPRLVALADVYSLWTDNQASNLGMFGKGDGATTMVLPNWSGKMAQFAVTAGGTVAAGLPNITGRIGKTWKDVWTLPTNNGYMGAIQLGPIDSNTTAIPSTMSSGTSKLPYYDNFNASWSNAIYGASTTVQPPAINVLAVMRY